MLISLGFFALELAVVSLLLLGAYHHRRRIGFVGVAAIVASLQFLQAMLSATVHWDVGGFLVSPGSTVLFTANVAILLVAYVRGGLRDTRHLLHAALAANIVGATVAALVALHMSVVLPARHPQFLGVFYGRLSGAALAGATLLFLDQVLAVLVHVWLQRRFRWIPQPVRMALTLLFVLDIDTVAYVGVLSWDSPGFPHALVSGLVGKSIAAVTLGLLWGFYLGWQERRTAQPVQRVIDALLFGHDLESLRDAVMRDELTGLYSRRFFDMLATSSVTGSLAGRLGVLVCDVNHFKTVNDRWGHGEGDRVLASVAGAIRRAVREDDLVFRYGGDEFVVVVLDAEPEGLAHAARRLGSVAVRPSPIDRTITVSVGTALAPIDGRDIHELFAIADGRQYDLKRRLRPVSGRAPAIEEISSPRMT